MIPSEFDQVLDLSSIISSALLVPTSISLSLALSYTVTIGLHLISDIGNFSCNFEAGPSSRTL